MLNNMHLCMQSSQTCLLPVQCGDGEHVLGELKQLNMLPDAGATDASIHYGGSPCFMTGMRWLGFPRDTTVCPPKGIY